MTQHNIEQQDTAHHTTQHHTTQTHTPAHLQEAAGQGVQLPQLRITQVLVPHAPATRQRVTHRQLGLQLTHLRACTIIRFAGPIVQSRVLSCCMQGMKLRMLVRGCWLH